MNKNNFRSARPQVCINCKHLNAEYECKVSNVGFDETEMLAYWHTCDLWMASGANQAATHPKARTERKAIK